MKALISPNEPVSTGYRVAEFADAEFPVAAPLFWLEVAALDGDCGSYYYDPPSEQVLPVPVVEAEAGEETTSNGVPGVAEPHSAEHNLHRRIDTQDTLLREIRD